MNDLYLRNEANDVSWGRKEPRGQIVGDVVMCEMGESLKCLERGRAV